MIDDERQARIDLAACYRLHALNGWTDLIYTHISARVPGTQDHFLLNPFGLLFEARPSGMAGAAAQAGPHRPFLPRLTRP